MFARHLTHQLRLPGLARSAVPVWVTARGRKPDVLNVQRASPALGYYLVHGWAGRADLLESVEQIFVSVGGELVAHPMTEGDRLDPLIQAFLDERLWLWEVPCIAVDAPAVFPEMPIPTPASGPITPTGTWRLVDFMLARADGRPATHVASGAEDPQPQFKWVLEDPDDLVTGGRIELYRADVPDLTPPFAVLQLGLGQVLSLCRPFNGFTGAGYLSCEGSPYRARLVVEGRPRRSLTRWAMSAFCRTRKRTTATRKPMIPRTTSASWGASVASTSAGGACCACEAGA